MRRITTGEIAAATGLSDAEAYQSSPSWWSPPSADDTPLAEPSETEYPAQMDDDLHALGEDLITTAARGALGSEENGFGISLAAARLLARLQDDGPTRISELAVAEKCSQPTITNHVKRLEAARLVDRAADPRDARAWMIKLTKKGNQQLSLMRARSAPVWSLPWDHVQTRPQGAARRRRGDAAPDGSGERDSTLVTQHAGPGARPSAFRLYDTATQSVRPFEPVVPGGCRSTTADSLCRRVRIWDISARKWSSTYSDAG